LVNVKPKGGRMEFFFSWSKERVAGNELFLLLFFWRENFSKSTQWGISNDDEHLCTGFLWIRFWGQKGSFYLNPSHSDRSDVRLSYKRAFGSRLYHMWVTGFGFPMQCVWKKTGWVLLWCVSNYKRFLISRLN